MTLGPALPRFLSSSAIVELQDSVVLVGGVDRLLEEKNENFYQLTSPLGTWMEMQQKLKDEYPMVVALMVPDEAVECV